MAERWYAAFKKATGELISIGTVVGDSFPADLEVKELIGYIPPSADDSPEKLPPIWNATTRQFDARPDRVKVDRVADFFSSTKLPAVVKNLPVSAKNGVIEALVELLGDKRMRWDDEPKVIA